MLHLMIYPLFDGTMKLTKFDCIKNTIELISKANDQTIKRVLELLALLLLMS